MQPQPKVTLAPSTSGQDNPAATPSQPQRPQPQYYVPSTSVHDPNAASQPTVLAKPVTGQSSTTSTDPNVVWGTLSFEGKQVQLKGERVLVGRYDHDLSGDPPGVDLSDQPGADTTSRMHAVFEHIGNSYTLTDLNSTNATRINNKRIEPDKASPINDGDTLMFGKVTCTYKKV